MRRLTDEDRALIRMLAKQGKTIEWVAKQTGCDWSVVQKFLAKERGGVRKAKWMRCDHGWGPEHGLYLPSGHRYGVLVICVRCRARRTVIDGVERITPPVPRVMRSRAELVARLFGEA